MTTAVRRLASPTALLTIVVCLLAGHLLLGWFAFSTEVILVADKGLPLQRTTLWAPFVEWELANADYAGNPFDVHASVTFVHERTGESRTTEMFYTGDDAWAFRFTGTRTGEWSFKTSSDAAQLDSWRGTVIVEPNAETDVRGFLTTHSGKYAIPAGQAGALQGTLYNVYMNHGLRERVDEYSSDEPELQADIDEVLSEVEAHGLDALFVTVHNNWFELGAVSYRDHQSENPDPATFRVLETIVTKAHARGLHVHIWAWGDEQRRWTPIGVGGINGTADRRLQRYIAARLGPLPGWTMSYGFDLYEWVSEEQVRAWAEYLHERFGWPHLLMARERHDPVDRVFEFGSRKWLDVYSVDDRPANAFYDAAVLRLEARGLPVLFERRFLYLRDGVWDMETTRRALWQFTMAGGAGAIWGVMWDQGTKYPNPGQLRLHGEFWRERFLLDFVRADHVSNGYALMTPEATHYVFYIEGTDQLQFDLGDLTEPLPAVALDVKGEVLEFLDLDLLTSADDTWTAPYPSDWVVAVGRF